MLMKLFLTDKEGKRRGNPVTRELSREHSGGGDLIEIECDGAD